jgi:hypothetical protein
MCLEDGGDVMGWLNGIEDPVDMEIAYDDDDEAIAPVWSSYELWADEYPMLNSGFNQQVTFQNGQVGVLSLDINPQFIGCPFGKYTLDKLKI